MSRVAGGNVASRFFFNAARLPHAPSPRRPHLDAARILEVGKAILDDAREEGIDGLGLRRLKVVVAAGRRGWKERQWVEAVTLRMNTRASSASCAAQRSVNHRAAQGAPGVLEEPPEEERPREVVHGILLGADTAGHHLSVEVLVEGVRQRRFHRERLVKELRRGRGRSR